MKIFLENETGHEKALAQHLDAIEASKADAPETKVEGKKAGAKQGEGKGEKSA